MTGEHQGNITPGRKPRRALMHANVTIHVFGKYAFGLKILLLRAYYYSFSVDCPL